jgi:hypothetical protein
VFATPLPSTRHGADHMEKTSCNTCSIFACAYFGRCLEMGLYVTIKRDIKEIGCEDVEWIRLAQ